LLSASSRNWSRMSWIVFSDMYGRMIPQKALA
jgi:hypothetical protein